MPPLPVISGDDCVRALRRAGYVVKRQRGSHVRLTHPSRGSVTVPVGKTLKRGTLSGILSDAGLSVDELLALLG